MMLCHYSADNGVYGTSLLFSGTWLVAAAMSETRLQMPQDFSLLRVAGTVPISQNVCHYEGNDRQHGGGVAGAARGGQQAETWTVRSPRSLRQTLLLSVMPTPPKLVLRVSEGDLTWSFRKVKRFQNKLLLANGTMG
jgi:hypothetical protein